MYHTCLHCQKNLGANQAIEHLPIGRRVAFDGHKGRLWVVCGKCGRWNLVPFDDRWEALEECEKAYRGATQRASTGQISLARLGEGLDLVRIGEPLMKEMTSWRYGELIRRRKQRHLRNVGLGLGLGVPMAVAGVAALGALGVSAGTVLPLAGHAMNAAYRWLIPVLTLRSEHGNPIRLTALQVTKLGFHRYDSGAFMIRLGAPWERGGRIFGEPARRALATILANSNGSVREHDLSVAVKELERSGGSEAYLKSANSLVKLKPSKEALEWVGGADAVALIRPHRRLALEMALHEGNERRALEGELHLLLDAWREAEELAGISDRLAVPPKVEADLDQMKRGERPRP